jgi:hypothetical protein
VTKKSKKINGDKEACRLQLVVLMEGGNQHSNWSVGGKQVLI